jgi:hypothetical protein
MMFGGFLMRAAWSPFRVHMPSLGIRHMGYYFYKLECGMRYKDCFFLDTLLYLSLFDRRA